MAKIILNADLYENLLTEKPGDYTARPRITGTYRNANVADDIVAERTEYRRETILNILTLADEKRRWAVANGRSLVDGVGYFALSLSGPFEGDSPRYDPDKNKISVSFTPSKELLDALKEIDFNLNKATTGPVINQVTDVRTQSVNDRITPGKSVIINGVNLLVKGDDPANGVFFTPVSDGEPVKVEYVSRMTSSELIVEAPDLAEGQYQLSVTTQASSNYQLVKEPRTYIFPIILTVGGSDGSGDEGGSPGEI